MSTLQIARAKSVLLARAQSTARQAGHHDGFPVGKTKAQRGKGTLSSSESIYVVLSSCRLGPSNWVWRKWTGAALKKNVHSMWLRCVFFGDNFFSYLSMHECNRLWCKMSFTLWIIVKKNLKSLSEVTWILMLTLPVFSLLPQTTSQPSRSSPLSRK